VPTDVAVVLAGDFSSSRSYLLSLRSAFKPDTYPFILSVSYRNVSITVLSAKDMVDPSVVVGNTVSAIEGCLCLGATLLYSDGSSFGKILLTRLAGLFIVDACFCNANTESTLPTKFSSADVGGA
jgi:hypothetical protein